MANLASLLNRARLLRTSLLNRCKIVEDAVQEFGVASQPLRTTMANCGVAAQQLPNRRIKLRTTMAQQLPNRARSLKPDEPPRQGDVEDEK